MSFIIGFSIFVRIAWIAAFIRGDRAPEAQNQHWQTLARREAPR